MIVVLRRLDRSLAAAAIASAMLAAPAFAGDSVARALLETLRANGTIDAKQYEELTQLVEDEEAAAAANAAPPAKPKPHEMEAYFQDGFRLETASGDFKLRIGGRINNDWGIVAPDQDLQDFLPNDAGKGTGTTFRRVRLAVTATMYERLDAKIELDFAGGNANLRDAWIEALKLPYAGTFRVGHFKEPLSLEQMMSANYTTFIERSLMDAFAPGRNTGFAIFNAPLEQRMTWALGTFRQTNNNTGNGFSDQATYNITGRVTGLPWYANEGEHLLHVGLGASQRFLDGADVQYQSIPEVSLNDPSYVNTQPIPATGAQILTPELALVYGPFSFQTEYTHTWVQGDGDTPNTDYWGVYAYASWFLTGEHRSYKTSEGVFDKIVPEENFDFHGGLGAWEVAARYSHIDLDDDFVEGGKLDDGTLGVNWYLNPNFRWSLNYVYAHLQDVGNANQVVARFWVNF